ncbi:M48 family metalloprotease [Marinifilum sp. D714]|uniref:M48 family metalloprotease n=1 Tax=Marinifilum sp. D714 TaxID=2937523 RepID=UPI0027CB7FA8|nr:M48 family metalloprotease [Marinifilum sp. D714]MDQ2178076.1 M48 family metalloprotease [Marinifilum sp. D714]
MKTKLTLIVLLLVCFNGMANKSNYSFWTQKWMDQESSYEADSGDYYTALSNHSWNYKNRKILHDAAQEYLIQLEQQNAFYIDPELEDYLYQLINQIHPKDFPAQQKINLNIKVIKSAIPETFSFANGTIITSTGMLSLLQSEDELMAILAREIAHLTLDHNVKTYTATQTKKTISAIIGASVYVASTANRLDKGDSYWEADYLGSFMGASSELLSYGILSALGVGYNRSRIYEADEIAQEWMMKNNRNVHALAQVIRRLQFFEAQSRGTINELSENRFFLKNRFENILNKKKYHLKPTGIKMTILDKDYDTYISDCLKTNAKLLVANEYYTEALPLLNRSIQSHWTEGETYLLKAVALRHTNYSEEDNQNILTILDKAENNAVADLPWVWSERALIHLRLNEKKKALDALIRYEEYFAQEQSENMFWARRMIAKLNKVTN